MSSSGASGRYHIERCDYCYNDYPRFDLRRKIRATGHNTGSNALLFTRWSDQIWTSSSLVDKGDISMGAFVLKYRPTMTPSAIGYDVADAAGSKTFSGSGTIYTTASVDISSFNYVGFSLKSGYYHANLNTNNITAVMGFCNSGCSVKYPQRTWTWNGGTKRIYFVTEASNFPLTDAYFYIDYTVTSVSGVDFSDYFFVDYFNVSDYKDPNRVLSFPYTNGAAVSRQDGEYSWELPVVCPKCSRDRIIKPSHLVRDFRFPGWIEILDEIEDL